MKKLFFTVLFAIIFSFSNAQDFPTQCDSLKVISLKYYYTPFNHDSYKKAKGFVYLNIENSIKKHGWKLDYPVWSIFNENGDTLGAAYGYTYVYVGSSYGFSNLIPESVLMVDSQEVASYSKLYIHLQDYFGRDSSSCTACSYSTYRCIIPFTQAPLDLDKTRIVGSEESFFYPNPISETVNFIKVQPLVEIIDSKGKLLISKENVSIVDASNLSSGVYSMRLQNSRKEASFHKLIVN